MYKVKVYGGEKFAGYASAGETILEFSTYEAAHSHAESMRKGSSIGVWFKVEQQ
ncbi:hypothetical protein [Paenibacillus xylanexedens]|uniref:hypothetical protein n=1 Tax=Paenibacillus xylanexedens TaxID=528191 RepID=UPI001642D167|nr:hypothetical protein [Paenibacillus xylanexedens]